MQDVFIIGSKGIPAAYGGFETFVERLTAGQVNKDITYHVACIDNETREDEHNGAHCFHVRVPDIGPARAVFYDLASLKYVISYIKKNQVEHPIVYVLACRIGPFIKKYAKQIHALGGKLYVNPDGHEWKRAKWSRPIQKYWKYSEEGMVKHADLLICDSQTIEAYIRKDYAKYHPRTTYIAYGAEEAKKQNRIEESDLKYRTWLAKYSIQEGRYYLVVGRMVPENNYETMIREYMRSNSENSLVFITDHEGNRFYEDIRNRTMFGIDTRIKFVGTVYDQELLSRIRTGAYGYIHGHEVGGTNPSLLEALSTTNINLLLDVGFNREVACDAALYWNKKDGSLCNMIAKADAMSEEECLHYGQAAKERIREAFSWEYIIEQYEDLFVPDVNARSCSVRRPMVSVCMTTYNGAKYVREQVESILCQLRYDDELIISDDGSTDGTLQILEDLEQEDARIHLIVGPKDGVKQNFANAIRHSSLYGTNTSGFVFLADQDDIWMEDKVSKVLETFERTNADLVVHDVVVVNEDCRGVLMESYYEYRHSGPGACKNIMKNTYMGCAMAFRSSVIMDILPIPDNIAMHDWWIGVRNDLSKKGTVFIKDKLLMYRRHVENVSDFEHNSLPVMIYNRVVFLSEIRKKR